MTRSNRAPRVGTGRARGLGGRRASPHRIGLGIVVAVLLGAWLALAAPALVAAASPGSDPSPSPATAPVSTGPPVPTATAPAIIDTGDPRSNGQGPGLVGSPVAILVGVVFLGVAAAGGTLLYLRVTKRG